MKKLLLLALTGIISFTTLITFPILQAKEVATEFTFVQEEYFDLETGLIQSEATYTPNVLATSPLMAKSWIRSNKLPLPPTGSNIKDYISLTTLSHYILFWDANDVYIGYKRTFNTEEVSSLIPEYEYPEGYIESPTHFLGTTLHTKIFIPAGGSKIAIMSNIDGKDSIKQDNRTYAYTFEIAPSVYNFEMPAISPIYDSVESIFNIEMSGDYTTLNINPSLDLDQTINRASMNTSLPSNLNGLSISTMNTTNTKSITIDGTATDDTYILVTTPNLITGYFTFQNTYGEYNGVEGSAIKLSNGINDTYPIEFYDMTSFSGMYSRNTDAIYDRLVININAGDSFEEFSINVGLYIESQNGLTITPDYTNDTVEISGTANADTYLTLTVPKKINGKFIIKKTNGFYNGVEGSALFLTSSTHYQKIIIELYDLELYPSGSQVIDSLTGDYYDRVTLQINEGDSFVDYVLELELYELAEEPYKDISQAEWEDFLQNESDFNEVNAFNSLLTFSQNNNYPLLPDIQGQALIHYTGLTNYFTEPSSIRFWNVNGIVSNYEDITGYEINTLESTYLGGDYPYIISLGAGDFLVYELTSKTEFRYLYRLYQNIMSKELLDDNPNYNDWEIYRPEFFDSLSGITSENMIEEYILYTVLDSMPPVSKIQYLQNALLYENDVPDTGTEPDEPDDPIVVGAVGNTITDFFDGLESPALMKLLLVLSIIVLLSIGLFILKAPWIIILFMILTTVILFTLLSWISTWVIIIIGALLFMTIILLHKGSGGGI